MKLAAEAKGAERQRWITAALAWSELSSLRGAAEPIPEGSLRGSSLPVQGAAPSRTPFRALGSRSGETRCRTRSRHQS